MHSAPAAYPALEPLLERCTFPPPGSHLDCAVSGGADSLSLLVLAVAAGCKVTAWHVDHGLREGSELEGETVAAASARFGAEFRSVHALVEPGPNLEARAREARFAALPAEVSTGHTADDQAETVLINLMRGSGLEGLAGMRPGRRHPILGLRRVETHKLCAEMGLVPLVDPSNEDRTILRNALRHEVMPLLDRLARRDLGAVIARQAGLLADDADLLEELSSGIDAEDAASLSSAPPPLARRAVRRMLRPHLGGRPPGSAAVERVLAVARGESGATEVADGVRVERRSGRLAVTGP